MSDPLIRECDYFLVLEPAKPERVLTYNETLEWLQTWLGKLETLPVDLQSQATLAEAAKRLIDTACDLDIYTGFTLQWFAVRIDRPNS